MTRAIGDNSVVIGGLFAGDGAPAESTGNGSIAVGGGTVSPANASGDGSVAVGNNAVSSGLTSVVLGANSSATGGNSVALGASSIASGSTDGVNGGQLFTANQRVATAFGGGAFTAVDNIITMQNSTGAALATQVGMNTTNIATNTANITNINANGTTYFRSNSTATGSVAVGVGVGASATNGGAAFGDNAVAVGQLNNLAGGFQSQVNSLQSQINDNLFEARAGVALALAASGLRYDDRPGKLSVAGAFGGYKGASGLAFGLGYAATDRVRFNASISGLPSQASYGGAVGGSLTLN